MTICYYLIKIITKYNELKIYIQLTKKTSKWVSLCWKFAVDWPSVGYM